MSGRITDLNNKKQRRQSSRDWLLRQLNDPYVKQAKHFGYRSRAAFKLLEIDNKYEILKNAKNVLDLGCAPGSWLQVVKQKAPNCKLLGVDLQTVEPIEGVFLLKADFDDQNTLDEIFQIFQQSRVDVILSDMAAPACGIKSVDHLRIMRLLKVVFDYCDKILREDGNVVAKVLRGGTENSLLAEVKKRFKKVVHFKPNSSRTDSSEIYLIAIGYKGNSKKNDISV